VLVVTRRAAVPVLTWIVIAPATRTIRHIPTEVALGPDHGLAVECVASFDNLQPIRRTFLTERVGEPADTRTSATRISAERAISRLPDRHC
jgi:mRNA-degrading endonuclease toxin of MazEF toxin-antitoxin module